MPRKRRQRSAAQIRQTQSMRKRRWASPGEAEDIDEVYRCMTIEEYKDRMAKAEREVEKGRKDLGNAERRLARMAEKVEATKHETKGLENEVDQVNERLETATAECAQWKERTVELQRALHRIKHRESRGPKGISNAVNSAITALASLGKPLSPPEQRVKGRVYELVNELVFAWRLPPSMVPGVIDSVSQATVDVCYGGHVDDADIDVGEHHEFEEHGDGDGGSQVIDTVVAGPSNTVVPSPEEVGGENI